MRTVLLLIASNLFMNAFEQARSRSVYIPRCSPPRAEAEAATGVQRAAAAAPSPRAHCRAIDAAA